MASDKVDPVKMQNIISQGIQIKKRELSVTPAPEPAPEPSPVKEEEPVRTVERAKRKTVIKGDYETLFIFKNDLKERKTIYVAKELQEKLAEIVMSMKNREMTVGIYVENIILHHFETYKDDINTLSEIKFKKLL